MKLYFDTNMIYTHFENVIKQKSLPEVIKFLYNVAKKHHYFVSNLTKAEVFRKLHSELGVTSKDCYILWDSFIKSLNMEEIIIENADFKISFDYIAKMLSERPAPKGIIVNLIHSLVAKENSITVLTGDKVLRDRFKIFYTEVIDYESFRKTA